MTTTVLLVDDDDEYRCGLRELLDGHDDIDIVADTANVSDAVALAGCLQPDAALMDVRMPDNDGISGLVRLKHVSPATTVVMLTLFADQDPLLGALSAGANGFCLKSAPPEQIARAVHKAVLGDLPIDPAMTHHLAKLAVGDRPAPSPVDNQLTRREHQVLTLLGEGLPDKTIAARLGLRVPTVRTYLERIQGKLGPATRVQLALIARSPTRHTPTNPDPHRSQTSRDQPDPDPNQAP